MDILNFFVNDSKAFLPEIFLFSSAMFILVVGVIYSMDKAYGYAILTRPVLWIVLQIIFFTLLLVINSPFSFAFCYNNFLIIDYLTNFTKLVVLFSSGLVLLISLDYIRYERISSFEFPILALLACGGLLLVVSSYDLLAIYLAIELQSLVFYVMATIRRNSEYSTEAGLKYFILGAFSSGLLLLGCSLIYGFTGTTNLEELFRLFSFMDSNSLIFSNTDNLGVILGVVFLVMSLLFKLSVAPFHMWTPDVYEGSSTPVTAFFAVVPKLAILSLFIRIFMHTFNSFFFDYWQFLLGVSAFLSIFIGTFAALYQKKLKRLFAFSAIGHLGYMMIGFASGTLQGLQSVFLYFIIYIFMNLGIFSIILSLRNTKPFSQVRYISDLSLLARSNPILAFSFILFLFSIAGIPPLAGFFSKFYIFLSALSSSLYILAILSILLSVISCFYYIRLIKLMYFEKITEWPLYLTVSRENSLVLSISLFFIVFFIVYPSPILTLTSKVALNFYL